ncbi:MAG: RraA family protein, partial [Alphaproteobacteria bacterium]
PDSPFTKGPGEVGGPVTLGGRRVESGDIVLGDRDGVVVVPFDRIDATIARLGSIHAAEAALDREVEEGLTVPQAILDLLASEAVRRV